MKKLFISQPMKGKTDEVIKAERNALIEEAKRTIKSEEDIEVIDSFFEDAPKESGVVTKPVWYLGKSLMKLSEADYAVFGDHWEEYNGCTIEHEVCKRYGIKIVKD